MAHAYPADPTEAALQLFLGWFGAYYARSTTIERSESDGEALHARIGVARKWSLSLVAVNTMGAEADLPWEAARAAVEKRLDADGRSVALWVPRGAPLPAAEPRLSELIMALDEARTLADGRQEIRRTVSTFLRRTSTTGSVVTILGGLSAHWAQFTSKVPGSFQLNSSQLFRLPFDEEDRKALADRIVLAAGQPEADESQTVRAEDAWTVTSLPGWRSCVIGSPKPDTDEASAGLRRNLRRLLKAALPALETEADARVLVVLGAATYANEEKLSWTLRGMDPSLYAGYDLVCVIADGVVKPLLQPGRSTMPWDAPLPGR